MTKIIVDVEADGPCPGLYSMVSFGAVPLDNPDNGYYSGVLKPISIDYIPEALAVSGVTRTEQEAGRFPIEAMTDFSEWLSENSKKGERIMFLSDNNGFDWQFINYYFWLTMNENPFGHSSMNINSLWKGMGKKGRWKRFRKTKHTHHPVDDARGNVEALLKMKEMGLKI